MASPGHTLSDLDAAATVAFSDPNRQRKIVLDKPRALVIVTLAYGTLAWGASLMFRYVEGPAGPRDMRAEQLTLAMAAPMAVFWLVSVFFILRRRRAG